MLRVPPYGTIPRMLWERSDFAALSFEAKALYTYLRTAPQGRALGAFKLHLADVFEHLGLPEQPAARALAELQENGFVQSFPRSWIWVIDTLTSNTPMTPTNRNHRDAVAKGILEVPNDVAHAIRCAYPEWFGDPIAHAIPHGLRDGTAKPPTDPMRDQEDVNGAGSGTNVPQGREKDPPPSSEQQQQKSNEPSTQPQRVVPMPDVRRAGSRR